MHLKKTSILSITFLILGLFLISSCAIFQSKYIEIEEENGECYNKYQYGIIENELIEVDNSEFNNLTFKIVDSERPQSEPEIFPNAIKLESQLAKYEIIFDFQLPISVKNNTYDIFVQDFVQSFESNGDLGEYKKIGTIELGKGGKREITISSKAISTGCISYTTKRKVLRSDLDKTKSQVKN
ncbi:hypothetical protein [Aquimarina algiphila]|uniref:hypothetical protein n=1 Tax=Aquimarina algiphila TaxID=2047982 RepID=UPI0024926F05|nr:hypothetical protein [Aquimarina algiphila]